jgi:subtilisin family serine protease
MLRLLILAVAAVALSNASLAQTGKKAKLSAAVAGKTATPGEIASAIAKDGSVRVIVIVRSAGKTSEQLATLAHKDATRAATKQEIAEAIDAVLSSHNLTAKAVKGAPAIVRLTTVPAFSAVVGVAGLDALANDSRVVSVEYDRPMKKQLAVTLPLIGMTSVQSGGGTGAGYAVALIDDGIQRDHSFLGVSRLISGREACFLDTNDCPNGTNEQIGTGAAAAASGASHGTHTAGISVGNRASGTPNKGVAPSAKLIPINVFGPNDSTPFSVIQRAFEHIEDLVLLNSGSNPLKIASVNMSIGGGASAGVCDADPTMALLKPVVDSLRGKNVLSAVSAGNDSETAAMSYPACVSSIISVAATSRSGVVASYTNISPSTDVFAPGGETGGDCVVSSVPTNAFDALCGTSMAAPHVAGAIAVLKQKVPTATACQIEDALKATGATASDSRTGGTIAKPRIRVNRALARLQSPVIPANDAFANAIVIPPTVTQASFAGSNIGASLETGEPHHVRDTSGRSVWWQWRASSSGTVTIDSAGSGFDTVLVVYEGATSASSLGTRIAQSDNVSATDKTSSVTYSALAGRTYHIVVAGKTTADECTVSLNISRPPANDKFTRAREVTVSATQEAGVGGSNVGATKEVGEPDHNGGADHRSTVWFRFTAPVSGPITIDTEGSPLADTVLAVYTGAAVDALTAVASDDDGGSGLWSRATFDMVAGTSYNVVVSGFGGAVGRYRLWFSPAGALLKLDRSRVASE